MKALDGGAAGFSIVARGMPAGATPDEIAQQLCDDYEQEREVFREDYSAYFGDELGGVTASASSDDRRCVVCNGSMTGKRGNAEVCSDACRQKRYRRRRAA